MTNASRSEIKKRLVALLPKLRRFALSLTGNMDDAEDLLHATVEKALSKIDQLSDLDDLDKWMFRICRNNWVDEWRQRKVRGPSVDPTDLPNEPSTDGAATAEQQIEIRQVSDALQELPEEQRMIVVLVIVEGHSYKEVSAMLDVPIGTVMSRLGRARAKLASHLKPPDIETRVENDEGH